MRWCVCARDRGGHERYAAYEWAQTGKAPVLRKRLHPAVTSGVCPCWAQEADDMVLKRSLWKQDGEDTGR